MLEPRTISRLVKNRHVVVLCVGSNAGDDAAGPMLYNLLHSKLSNIKVLLGGNVPDKSLSQIVACKPDTVMMVNAVDKKLRPGDVVIEDVSDHHASYLMHKFPLSLLANLIAMESGKSVEVKLVGLQAKKLFGRASREVTDAVANLAKVLLEHDRWAAQAG